ncbi:MAG: ABC transporter ATP-binding protein [Armatimonadetes bacterium]|nr:ABC transporter ATP-binding protein [Armatimonadota bacterium]
MLGLPADRFDPDDALGDTVLEEDTARMPDGADTRIGPRGVRLSGALDIETERLLWERILARPGATCQAVSHSRFVQNRADTVLVLKDGRLEAAGPPENLLQTSEEMRLIWHGKLRPGRSWKRLAPPSDCPAVASSTRERRKTIFPVRAVGAILVIALLSAP